MKFQRKWRWNQVVTPGMVGDPKCMGLVIQSYADSKNLNAGKQLHAFLLRTTLTLCRYVSNHLLNMYAKCGHVGYAHNLFDEMPQRNLVSWTAMITAFSQNFRYQEAILTFKRMRVAGERPTEFAYSSVVQATVLLRWVHFGKQLHCLSLKSGFNIELFVGSNLADMYSKCGLIFDACKVFEEMVYKDEVSWTAMIDGYAKNYDFEGALLGFKKMLYEGIKVDDYVLCSTLNACGSMKNSWFGKCLHSIAVKMGLDKETIVGNALTDVYSKVGEMGSASNVFGGDPKCMNVVSYTSLIDGYAETDQPEKALDVFVVLKRHKIEPNEFTFSSLIKACANQAVVEQGTQLHAQVIKHDLVLDPFVSSSLVDMYGKCGLVDDSERLFSGIKNPSLFAWNSMVGTLAQHGLGKRTIEVFDRMVQKGMKPDAITFVSLLIGCSHSGLVQEGLNYFYAMEGSYGVIPTQEHYSCVIDLLSRAGKLKETEELILKMPFEPNAFGWCSFLAACRIYGDTERAEFAADNLRSLEPDNTGVNVLLSNIYAKEKQWENVRNMRKMMKNATLKKIPGYSWLDVGNKTHVFGADDWSHPEQIQIYNKLHSLINQITESGYLPRTDSIPGDMDERVKEQMLHYHSEKIAVAFALISVPSWKPIIIKKNLRVCVDCHDAMKLISKVVGRTIIVRDNSRFHHFSDGYCSCTDYW